MTGPGPPDGGSERPGFTAGRGGWTYAWDHARKPHLHPVATPSGLVLTQVEPPDHPWQRGIWLVVKLVDGDNFWEEYDPAGWGIQRHVAPPEVGGSTVAGDLAWVRPDRETVAVREHRRLTHVDLDADAYAIDWDSTLTADHDVVLDRTPYNGVWGGYSGLAFRGRADWADTALLVDDGTTHERLAPQPSRWCDLASADGGVCILDHPDNPGTPDPGGSTPADLPAGPVPFYATTRAGLGYGEGWANTVYPAFLWHGPMTLPAGERLRLRYRIVIHDGAWGHDACHAAWAAYAG